MFDDAKLKAAVHSLIESIGEDPHREGLEETPRRVAEMYAELVGGYNINPREELKVGYELGHREMVIARDIPFYSLCEHHLLPFYGTVSIGYIPDATGRVVGISKLARVVDILARRLQIQERLTTEIADSIMKGLKPSGVAVVVRAEHLCMIMRGVKKPGSNIITSAIRGIFKTRAESRAEFFSLLHNSPHV